MRIIIPMAGMGTRLKPHTLTVPKPLTVLAGKSIVQRLVEEISTVVDEPIEKIAFIIGPESKGFRPDTREKLHDIARRLHTEAHIFVQEEPLGTAHAIYQAESLLQGKCVVAFADTLFKGDFELNPDADGVIWVHKEDRPEQFGVVRLDEKNRIIDFVEKPETFVSDLAIIGIYYFKEAAHLRSEIKHIIEQDIRGKGNEYQLTDALDFLNKKGFVFVPGKVDDWMDNGKKKVVISTHAKILDYDAQAGVTLISGKAKIIRSEIIPPCHIADGVQITDSVIGPYVSLEKNTKVENSHIKNSLIQDETHILNARLENAMIGSHAIFDGEFNSVSLGDYSQLIKE